MLSKYDHQLTGIITALVIGILGYFLLQQINDLVSEGAGQGTIFTERTIALIAIVLNLFPMNYFRRTYQNKSLRGLVMGTMLLAAGWFFWFGRDLLG